MGGGCRRGGLKMDAGRGDRLEEEIVLLLSVPA